MLVRITFFLSHLTHTEPQNILTDDRQKVKIVHVICSMIRMTAVSLCRVPPISFCLFSASASSLRSVLSLIKHTFIRLGALFSDTVLRQHMFFPQGSKQKSSTDVAFPLLLSVCLSIIQKYITSKENA